MPATTAFPLLWSSSSPCFHPVTSTVLTWEEIENEGTYRFFTGVSDLFSRARFLPSDWSGNAGISTVSAMHRRTQVMSSNTLSSPTSIPPSSVASTNQENAMTITKNPPRPPCRRPTHSSPTSGTSCRKVPSSSRRHLGCSPCHHFCHDALYFVRLAIFGIAPYLRPFLNHAATSIGRFFVSILPYKLVSFPDQQDKMLCLRRQWNQDFFQT